MKIKPKYYIKAEDSCFKIYKKGLFFDWFIESWSDLLAAKIRLSELNS